MLHHQRRSRGIEGEGLRQIRRIQFLQPAFGPEIGIMQEAGGIDHQPHRALIRVHDRRRGGYTGLVQQVQRRIGAA